MRVPQPDQDFPAAPPADPRLAASETAHPPLLPSRAMLALLHMLVDDHHAERALQRDDADGFESRAHRAGRIEALQALAPPEGEDEPWIDLELLVRDSLRGFQFGESAGIAIAGASMLLHPAPARLLTLVLHELTTNAIKFGALSGRRPGQMLRIGWRNRRGGLELRWQESGTPILDLVRDRRSGFGRHLIKTLLPMQFGIRSSFALLPGGVHCSFLIQRDSYRINLC